MILLHYNTWVISKAVIPNDPGVTNMELGSEMVMPQAVKDETLVDDLKC